MPDIENIEMDRHRKALIADIAALVEKYRKIFDWDVPDIDQGHADQLIVAEMRAALERIGKELLIKSSE